MSDAIDDPLHLGAVEDDLASRDMGGIGLSHRDLLPRLTGRVVKGRLTSLSPVTLPAAAARPARMWQDSRDGKGIFWSTSTDLAKFGGHEHLTHGPSSTYRHAP